MDKTGQAKRKAFLDAYRKVGVISAAARAAGINRPIHYEWRKDPEYAKAFAQADDDATEALIAEARRRAYLGTKSLVLYKGKPVTVDGERVYEDKYHDSLLMFLVKGKRPEYRDRYQVEVGGMGGGPIPVIFQRVESLDDKGAGAGLPGSVSDGESRDGASEPDTNGVQDHDPGDA